jgi:hypothetical protein
MTPEHRVTMTKVKSLNLMIPRRNLTLKRSLLRQRAIRKILQIVMRRMMPEQRVEKIKTQRMTIHPIEPEQRVETIEIQRLQRMMIHPIEPEQRAINKVLQIVMM